MVIFLTFDSNKARLSPWRQSVVVVAAAAVPKECQPVVVVKLTHNAPANTLYNMRASRWPHFPEVIDTFCPANELHISSAIQLHTCTYINSSPALPLSAPQGLARIVNYINRVSSCQHLGTILLIT